MLRYALLASAMTMATPAIAQQAQTAPQTAPATGADATGTAAAAPNGAQTAPTTTTQADPVAASTTPAQTATSEPATQGTNQPDQVAAILDSEFPSYDKDKSGALSKAEFASWMDTLKAKADPAAKPDKAWNTAAFNKADTDRSASVSKTELATFLSSSAKQPG